MNENPDKNDIEACFKSLKSMPTNKVCFDCNAKNPSWASVTYGVFICIDCSAVHRKLGVHLSFVRSTQLDTNWSWMQLRQMQVGGNANASSFFRQHNCTTTDTQQKYNSRAAQLYKEKLSQSARKAMEIYDTQLHIEHIAQDDVEPKECDFFDEHILITDDPKSALRWDSISSTTVEKDKEITSPASFLGAPNVENAFTSGASASDKSSSIVGNKMSSSKRQTLGGKKGSLGAQRVKANFAEIERDAELADQIKFAVKENIVPQKLSEDAEELTTSTKLAYQDLSLQQKKVEEKIKLTSPNKAEQIERLGMGFHHTKQGISHSALSDMETLETTPVKKKSALSSMMDKSDEEDFFDCISSFTLVSSADIRDLDELYSNSGPSKKIAAPAKSDWSDFLDADDNKERVKKSSTKKDYQQKFEESKKVAQRNVRGAVADSSRSGEAQKKFGSAKSISSAQYFGDSADSNEDKMNLCQFEGSTSISSAQLFGKPMENSSAGLQVPDFDDVKESVRQGVTKVAGKLSNLTQDFVSHIQDRYGGY